MAINAYHKCLSPSNLPPLFSPFFLCATPVAERCTDWWVHAPAYLTAAANAGDDAVERMKCAVTAVISGLHACCSQVGMDSKHATCLDCRWVDGWTKSFFFLLPRHLIRILLTFRVRVAVQTV